MAGVSAPVGLAACVDTDRQHAVPVAAAHAGAGDPQWWVLQAARPASTGLPSDRVTWRTHTHTHNSTHARQQRTATASPSVSLPTIHSGMLHVYRQLCPMLLEGAGTAQAHNSAQRCATIMSPECRVGCTHSECSSSSVCELCVCVDDASHASTAAVPQHCEVWRPQVLRAAEPAGCEAAAGNWVAPTHIQASLRHPATLSPC
jgi:hypothetical protein